MYNLLRCKRAATLTCALWLACGFTLCAAATLPRLEADSLGSTHVVLPTDAAGRSLVLLLAFTPESQADVTAWSRAMLADRNAAPAAVYVVAVADHTAFTSRRHIRSLVTSSAVGTRRQMDDNVLITFTGDGWRGLTPPGDKRTAGVVVCTPSGDVVFAKRILFNDAALAQVDHALLQH
jgi:hypothetical protein